MNQNKLKPEHVSIICAIKQITQKELAKQIDMNYESLKASLYYWRKNTSSAWTLKSRLADFIEDNKITDEQLERGNDA
jgi:hypothetical protein